MWLNVFIVDITNRVPLAPIVFVLVLVAHLLSLSSIRRLHRELDAKMTRFRAYASDSSEDEEEQVQAALHSQQQQQQQHQHSNQQHPQHTERLSHSGSEAGSEGEGDLAESDEEEDEGSEGSDEEDHSDPDEEADDDEETQGAGRRRRVSRRMRLVQNEDGEYELAHGADGDEGGELDDNGPHGDRSLIPWAQQVGVDAQRMHVMQASMFRVPEEAAALRALQFNGVPVPPPPRLLPINSRQSSRKHSRDSDGENMPVDAREVCCSGPLASLFSWS